MLWVALHDNKIPHLVVMWDKARDLKISLVVVGHVHCTHPTAAHHMKKLQLGLTGLGDRYGILLVSSNKCGVDGPNGRRIRDAKHQSSDQLLWYMGIPRQGLKTASSGLPDIQIQRI